MVFASNNCQLVIGCLVDESMFVCDAAGPISLEVALKRLRLADAGEGVLAA